jgi:tripartite-type tricarboxylate transporter receptor subunit TctC
LPVAAMMRFTLLCSLCAAALQFGAAAAQSYPDRPLKLIVPYAAGGGADLIARTVAEGLTKKLGQPVIVENKPGGAATIGADAVAKSPPDGYTILYGTPAPQIINPYLMKKLPYDPVRDFAPVGRVASVSHILVVHPSVPAKSVKELVAYAKANPGKVNYSSAGIGATSHLDAELFKALAGIEIVHVPYKGTGSGIQDLLSGNVQMTIDSIGPLLPYIKSGKLRPLGVTSTVRSPLLPDVPPIADQLPGFSATTENYLAVRAGTPKPIIDRLNSALNEVLRTPDVRDHLIAAGVTPTASTPQELEAMIRSESVKWKKVIEVSGATAE